MLQISYEGPFPTQGLREAFKTTNLQEITVILEAMATARLTYDEAYKAHETPTGSQSTGGCHCLLPLLIDNSLLVFWDMFQEGAMIYAEMGGLHNESLQ